MRRVSESMLRVLSKTIGIEILEADVGIPPSLTRGVVELSRQFTRERRHAPSFYMDDRGLGSAYLAYFYPVNLAKVQMLLDELSPALYWRHDNGTTRVLDLGCGPGTGIMAVLDWALSNGLLESGGLDCVALDRSGLALSMCGGLWDNYRRAVGTERCRVWKIHSDLRRDWRAELRRMYGASQFDLIIMQNVLGEMFVGESDCIDRRAGMVMAALDVLADKGTVMLVEPALRDSSRALHEVRDHLLEANACTVYSPCLHDGPCPALAQLDDWCHEERAWDPPAWVQMIDKEVGFIKDALKFSYVLLRKDGRTVVERDPHLYRVVSELRVMKGEKRAWLCHETGRPEVGRLDRLASPRNAAVDGWHRGAIVRISDIARKERKGRLSTVGRIQSDTAVQIVRPV